MNTPSYEVGRLAALTVRMVLSSGLSRDEASAALRLARTMIEDDNEPATAKDDRKIPRPMYATPAAADRGAGTMSTPRG